jgi:ATP adenylyltransferase
METSGRRTIMKVLWAPWRMTYVKAVGKPIGCIFCLKTRERRDRANLLVHRGTHGAVLMNLYPYNSGHLLIAPYAHVDSVEALSTACSLELVKLISLSLRVLREELRPEGFNIGLNLGDISGAGIATHVHWHIVPRWTGDTNFMPLLADTRVMPEHLDITYRRLRRRFRRSADTPPNRRAPRGTRRRMRRLPP